MTQRGYYDPEQDSTPIQRNECFPVGNMRRAKRRAFVAAAVIFGAIGFAAGAAFGETISIGSLYTHGEEGKATTVTIEPSDVPGQLAIVTLVNRYVNQGSDDGDYSLALDGVVFGIVFEWDFAPVLGADRITVIPPDGILCDPVDCGVTVMEGAEGQVILFDWTGM
jgi:hypothetical protein